MVEISAESRKRTCGSQLAGWSAPAPTAGRGGDGSRPGSAGSSDSASSAAQAGWVKSPVPTTVTPLRTAHQASVPASQFLLQAREKREWMCRSA